MMINNTHRTDNNYHQSTSMRNAIIANNLFENRDVQRAGWLKYIPFAEKYSPSDDHRFWVVFAVYGSQTPYLEFYQQRQCQNQQMTHSDGPVSKHSLLNCRHITSVIELNQEARHNEFSITLETHVIRLAAETDEVMWDWIGCLKSKLIEMNILQPSENIYSKSPVLSTRRNPYYLASDGTTRHPLNNNSIQINQIPPNSDDLYEPIFDLSNAVQRISLNQNTITMTPIEEGPPPYECIFNNNCNNSGGMIHRPSFREAQVEKFKKEMEQLNGLTLKVRKKDCYNAIAFVDVHTFGIFIAGWKQKNHPYLHNTFHIGDQLVSINGTVMESSQHAKQFIKQFVSSNLDITIRRVPFGQIFCLKKSFDGEELGLVREKGTAQINYIIPGSVAARAGLLSKCTFYDIYDDESSNIVNQHNWFLTEINNRPLNLFFKNNEVADRLNAIGKEISILVQPYGFVKHLKRQLKTFKNYKDFIVQ